MNMKSNNTVKLGDYAALWIEQERSICLKLLDSNGDPIELTEDQAEELGAVLIQLAKQIRAAN
jgi:hypothetical protein